MRNVMVINFQTVIGYVGYVNYSTHDARKSVITLQDKKGSYFPHMYLCYHLDNVTEFGKH